MTSMEPTEQQPINTTVEPNKRPRRHHGFGRFLIGLVLLFVGVLYLLQNFGVLQGVDLGVFFSKIWPAAIILIGFGILSRANMGTYIISLILSIALVVLLIMLLLYPTRFKLNPDTFAPGNYNYYHSSFYGND